MTHISKTMVPFIYADVPHWGDDRHIARTVPTVAARALRLIAKAASSGSELDGACCLVDAARQLGKVEGMVAGAGFMPSDALFAAAVEIDTAITSRTVGRLLLSQGIKQLAAAVAASGDAGAFDMPSEATT